MARKKTMVTSSALLLLFFLQVSKSYNCRMPWGNWKSPLWEHFCPPPPTQEANKYIFCTYNCMCWPELRGEQKVKTLPDSNSENGLGGSFCGFPTISLFCHKQRTHLRGPSGFCLLFLTDYGKKICQMKTESSHMPQQSLVTVIYEQKDQHRFRAPQLWCAETWQSNSYSKGKKKYATMKGVIHSKKQWWQIALLTWIYIWSYNYPSHDDSDYSGIIELGITSEITLMLTQLWWLCEMLLLELLYCWHTCGNCKCGI